MIYESSFYKEELSKIAIRIEKQKSNKKRTERSFFLLEKDLFVAFFYIRKLLEAKTKLTSEVSSTKIKIAQFTKKPLQQPTILNNHTFQEMYDLTKRIMITKDMNFLCNQFTHSYIFCPEFDEDMSLDAFFINSFFEREKYLYKVHLKDLIKIIKSCSTSYPSEARMEYNTSKRDYEIAISK